MKAIFFFIKIWIKKKKFHTGFKAGKMTSFQAFNMK